ncbi:major facilitator superfamily domain-containing protein [Suillus paluster]|uniref:major facilitator superfamily domain-containing protein n=1 Tax=Suillus paluster TaxID=48578 RepID=UPI001B86768C|nr:major facilitator superfamily domain-containing protein [Suillus paluster]KAG1723017.1 major facilitator superfamily domain-containing protein [Suillus paluster]
MASVTSRASGFWADRMTYFEDTEQGIDDVEIGMGSYQWTLLSLCGFGWMADNMWIQAIAIILPRVQQHYSVPDNYIGTLSSSMFAGMMFGAVGWGTCSDLLGRSAAFNATLFFTALFGIMASFAWSFLSLCILLFFLGSAVGGSMPTDGTLLLEHMPNGKQYLVTALSVFFSLGSVLSAGVALAVIPSRSCPPSEPCDVATQNTGWQYMLITLGIITLSMFLARMVFFRLHESPRYLVHAGRHQEALESLQLISRFNGSELPLELEDVDDRPPPISEVHAPTGERVPFLPNSSSQDPRTDGETLFDAADNSSTSSDPNGTKVYQSMDEASHDALDGHLFITPVGEVPPRGQSLARGHHSRSPSRDSESDAKDHFSIPQPRPRPRQGTTHTRTTSVVSFEMKQRVGSVLPRWVRRPLLAWLDRVGMVLAPEWFRTTVLVWGVWFFMSLAYTMFNVYLPKLLETGSSDDTSTKSLEDSLWDVLIFTMGGCPGAILGAYMVESPLGRRGSLAATTFVTAFFCIVFVLVRSAFLVRASSVGISLSATTMYAVLYGWTPEIFGTKVRGTACGIASALSRIGGMIAPMLGGALLVVNRAFPVWTSVVVYGITGVFILLLHESAGNGGGERSFMH